MSTFNAGAIEASLTLDRSSWNRELKELEAQFEELEQKTITVSIDADADNFFVQANNVELFAKDLEETSVTVSVDMDSEKFHAGAAQVELTADALGNMSPTIDVDINSTAFHAGAAQVELTADLLGKMSPTIDVDMDSTAFHAGAAQVELVTDVMSTNDVVIGVETSGLPKTLAELAELEVAVDIVDSNDINIGVNYDKNNLERLVGSGAGGGGGGSMGLLQILIVAVIALSPILVVAVGAMGAALVGFTAALVGALGPLALLIGVLVLLIKQFKKTDPKDYTAGMAQLAAQLKILKDLVMELVHSDVGEIFFKSMATGVGAAIVVVRALTPLMAPLAHLFEDVANSVYRFVNSREFKGWLGFFGGFGMDMLRDFISIGGNLLRFFFGLFIAIAPFARGLMRNLTGDVRDLAEWSQHLGQDKGFQEWIQNAREFGPPLLELLGDLWHMLQHIADAIRPFAGPMIRLLDQIADSISAIPIPILQHLILGFAGLFVIAKVIPLVTGLVSAIEAVSGGLGALAAALGIPLLPLLAIVAAAVILGGALYYMWTTNKQFRDSLISAWDDIKKTVMPIIDDLVQLFKDEWPEIQKTAEDVWTSVQSIFEDAAGIIQQLVFFLTTTVTFIWKHFGDQFIKIAKASLTTVLGVIRGAFQIIAGLFALIDDLLHGRWGQLWGDIKQILRGALTVVVSLIRGSLQIFAAIFTIIFRTLTGIWRGLWSGIKHMASEALGWVRDRLGDFIGWLDGIGDRVNSAVRGMFAGIASEFKDVINTIIGWWNNLAFTVDIPNKIPGLPDSFTISTPNHSFLAKGAYVTEPMNAIIGEGSEPEIVSPESKMAEIVKKFSGDKMDYGKMTAALMQALAPMMGSVLTPELLDSILAKAGVTIPIDASNDDRSVNALARALGFQMRVLGYAGATP